MCYDFSRASVIVCGGHSYLLHLGMSFVQVLSPQNSLLFEVVSLVLGYLQTLCQCD